MDNEPEMGSIKTRFRKTIRVANLRRLAVGELGQWIVSVIPTLPSLLIAIFTKSELSYKYLFAMEIFLISLWLLFLGSASISRIRKIFIILAILVAWIPSVQILTMCFQIFPEVKYLLPFLFGFAFLSRLFHQAGWRLVVGLVIPFVITASMGVIVYHVDATLVALLLIGMCSIGVMVAFIEYHAKGKGFPILYVPLYIPFVAMLIICYTQAFNLYTTLLSTDSAEIEQYPGIERMDKTFNLLPLPEDIKFFLCGEASCAAFKHRSVDQLTWTGQNGRKYKTDFRGEVSDEPGANRDKGVYYFFVGKILYEYQVQSGVIREITSLERICKQLRPLQVTGNIREFPREYAKRLLIQLDNARGLAIYNIESDTFTAIPMKMRHTDSIWNADGSEIVTLALYDTGFGIPSGRLYLLDDSGSILRERNIGSLFGSFFAVLTQTDQDYFFIGYYFENRLEKVSYETLETVGSVEIEAGSRGMYFLSKWHCLIVPNFMTGTLRLVNTETLEVSDPIQIGQRVRAIVPAMEPDRYFISSVSGLFVLDFPELANGWEGLKALNNSTKTTIKGDSIH